MFVLFVDSVSVAQMSLPGRKGLLCRRTRFSVVEKREINDDSLGAHEFKKWKKKDISKLMMEGQRSAPLVWLGSPVYQLVHYRLPGTSPVDYLHLIPIPHGRKLAVGDELG